LLLSFCWLYLEVNSDWTQLKVDIQPNLSLRGVRMKPERLLPNNIDAKKLKTTTTLGKQQSKPQKSQTEKETLGQHLADKLASKVGSWSFLIAQTSFLTGWVTLNSIPGLPHWDQSPFILLNLMFSFASAYTAPIVLMSQNRQSDVDRENAAYDHEVNRKAEHSIGLLHEKMDSLHSQQLQELTQIVKQQQQALDEIRVSVVPVLRQQQQALNEMKVSVVPVLKAQQQFLSEMKVGVLPELSNRTDSKPNEIAVYLPFKLAQPLGDNSEVIGDRIRRSE
jgi:uncharacterized membrane protein